MSNLYSSLPPMFRPAKGQHHAPPYTTGEVPPSDAAGKVPPPTIPALDSRTLAEHFGLEVPPFSTVDTINIILAEAMLSGRLDPKSVTALHEEVVLAVRQLQREIAGGRVERRLRLIHGRPLCDWLSLDDVTTLLKKAGDQT